MADYSPMMKQYFEVKEKYPNTLLFFRLGDFYEMFFNDARIASRELELTLTGRDCGQEERAPMCGVPYHAVEQYIERLVDKGYKVAICEQQEDPAAAKGIVRRGVVKVVTAGTILTTGMLDDKENNYLCCICAQDGRAGIACADVTTGDFYVTEVPFETGAVLSELARYNPREIICNGAVLQRDRFLTIIKERLACTMEAKEDAIFTPEAAAEEIRTQFQAEPEQLPIAAYTCATCAVGALLAYLTRTQMCSLPHIHEIRFYTIEQYMDIDFASKRNLEITASMRDHKRHGSLLWVLDDTKTSLGARLLKVWLEKPLLNAALIQNRLNAVDELCRNTIVRSEMRKSLDSIQDLERLVSRVVTGGANCRDLLAIRNSLKPLPDLVRLGYDLSASMNAEVVGAIDMLTDIYDLLNRALIDEDTPLTVKEGGIIKDGFDADVDRYRKASEEGQAWITEMQQRERDATGIKNLKIAYNRVFGYYIEVSKSNLDLVPDGYIRKQTLANCERYVTGELKEVENSVLGAGERLCQLEYAIFCDIRAKVIEANGRILQTAKAVAKLDVLCALAEVAVKNRYCMPQITTANKISITNGRHPVVERVMKGRQMFIPNDTLLNGTDRVAIITGPNMAGKSTYMRQVALITLMAQIGSFVPAERAEIGIVDKIFTRVGASDDLASGQSTFMVEMTEVANILEHATASSLLILDEIGRGTSTYDGLSIAWAVVEYIADRKKLGAKTMFATHYHELTALEDKLDGVRNYCIAVKKRGDDIIFLRKIIRGGTDDSYGIEVAQLAGVKQEVIQRARELLADLETPKAKQPAQRQEQPAEQQLGFDTLGGEELVCALKEMDVTTLTPIEALNKLYELKMKAEQV